MAKEIERKFLVKNDSYKALAKESVEIVQGYLCTDPDATVRVRIKGDQAFITIKSRNTGAVRDEWEFSVPKKDALEILGKCCRSCLIEKRRWFVPYNGFLWEIDEFGGRHASLTVAEIELPEADAVFDIPDFIGEEITGNPAYYNSVLSQS